MSLPLVIADASPLIALARIEQLDLLKMLFDDIVITETVQQEVLAGGDFADSQPIKHAIEDGWVQVKRYNSPTEHSINAISYVEGLDAGETSSLLYASELKNNGQSVIVLIDEAKGRNIAERLSLEVIGSVGVIAMAKILGIISEARPLLEQLHASGYYLSTTVMKQGLQMADEN